MPRAEEINALLFLEGMEVPFHGATITSSENQYAQATIDLIPTDTIRCILPRTQVHIFWKDPIDKVFKLVFEGEVWGKGFNRTTESRGMQIVAFSYDFHWELSKRYYVDPLQSNILGIGQAMQQVKAEGGNENAIAPNTFGQLSSIALEIVDDPSTPYLTKVIQSTIKKLEKMFRFYEILGNRCRVYDRVVSSTSANIQEIFKAETVKEFMGDVAGGGNEVVSVKDVMNKLMAVIHHHYVSLAVPSYIDKTVCSYIFKPDCYLVPPPKCNVFFPDNYNTFSYSHQYSADPTRGTVSLPAEIAQTLNGLTSMCGIKYVPKELADHLKGMIESMDNSGVSVEEKKDCNYKYLTDEEKFRGIIHATPPAPPYMSQLLRDKENLEKYANDVANYEYYAQKYRARSVQISSQVDPWLVPGFPCLIVDNSAANQHVVANIASVQFRVNASEGGFTVVQFTSAREVDSFAWTSKMYFDNLLKKIVSEKMDEPAIPDWFDASWGTSTQVKLSKLAKSITGAKYSGSDIDVTVNSFDSINQNYVKLLGPGGGESITAYRSPGSTGNTILESAYRVINDYKIAVKRGDVSDWINNFKARRLPTIRETFDFLKAATQSKDAFFDGTKYTGAIYMAQGKGNSTFDGDPTVPEEVAAVKLRRSVIEAYRTELVSKRGYVG